MENSNNENEKNVPMQEEVQPQQSAQVQQNTSVQQNMITPQQVQVPTVNKKKFDKIKVMKLLKKSMPYILVGIICFVLGIGAGRISYRNRMGNAFEGRAGMNRMMPGNPNNGQRNFNNRQGYGNNQNQSNRQNPGSNQNSNNGQTQDSGKSGGK